MNEFLDLIAETAPNSWAIYPEWFETDTGGASIDWEIEYFGEDYSGDQERGAGNWRVQSRTSLEKAAEMAVREYRRRQGNE